MSTTLTRTPTRTTAPAPTSPPAGLGLARLLHPLAIDELFAETWERRALHLERHAPDFYAPLFDVASLDDLVANAEHLPDFTLALIQDGAIVHRTGGGVRRFGTGDALRLKSLDPGTVYAQVAAGATLRLTGLERHASTLWRMAGELERETGAEISVNLYLTPPRSQGFRPHTDDHDVLVLQLEGSKRWRFWEPTAELPVERVVAAHPRLHARPWPYAPAAAALPGADVAPREIVLRAGDALYLPRGYPHAAAAEEERSVHLTVGFTPFTWHEAVVHAVTRRLGEDIVLRTGLEPGFASDEAVAERVVGRREELATAVRRALAPAALAEAVADLANRYVYSRRLASAGQLGDLLDPEAVGLDTLLEIRPGTVARLAPRPDALYFFFSGRVLTLPQRVEEMLVYMLRERAFRVRDVASRLGDRSRLLLCRKLVAEGFLTPAEGG